MAPKKQTARWLIVGYDSTTELFRAEIPCGQITLPKLKLLLQMLVAKFGLTPNEIANSLLIRRARASMQHLEVTSETRPEQRKTLYHCGSNPYFVADVVR